MIRSLASSGSRLTIRTTARATTGFRQLIDTLINFPERGPGWKRKDGVMGVGRNEAVDKVFFFITRGGLPFPPTLRFVIRQRLILDVTTVRQRHDNIF